MANKSIVLNTGTVALLRALGDSARIPVGRFRVGDTFNVDPQETATAPLGNTIYTGGIEKISLDLISANELRITCNFSEDVGNFSIGNIVIDLFVEGEYVPFLMWVSEIPIPKLKFDSILGKIGNSLAISFTEKIENVNDALEINVLPVVYSSLPQYSDESSVPPADASLFQNFTLQTYKTLFRPVIAARRSIDNKHFGFPLLERIDNPFFGVRDGGVIGFNKAPFTGTWYWGGYLDTPEEDYVEVISGGFMNTPESEFGDTLVAEPLNKGII